MPIEDVIARQRSRLIRGVEGPLLRSLIREYARIVPDIEAEALRLAQRATEIAAAGGDPFATLLAESRLRALERMVRDDLATLANNAVGGLQRAQRAAVAQSLGDIVTTWATYEVRAQLNIPAVERIAASLTPRAPLERLVSRLGPEAADRVRAGLIRGVALGENPRRTASRIVDAMHGNRARALTIARTETLRAYRGANLETFQRNRNMIRGWVWISAMDARSCAMCIAMHGTVHPTATMIGTHPGCRCAMGPLPVGQPSPVALGPDEFAQWTTARQVAVLGQSKHAAYAAGRIELSDLVGVSRSRDWGLTRYERSLSDVLGSEASRFYRVA